MVSSSRTPSRKRFVPRLEALEDRWMPAVINVASTGQLAAAIQSAGNFDTILIQPGTYSVAGGFLNANLLTVNLTIKAASPNTVTIDGGGASDLMRILNPNGNPGTQLQFQDITFQRGQASLPGVGGGITIQNGTVTFTDCVFQNNLAFAGPGGGAMVIAGASTVHFNSCTFQANGATNTGGALSITSGANVIVDSSIFVGNTTTIGGAEPTSEGGAIDVSDSTLTVNNTRFDSNQAFFSGGAIQALGTFRTSFFPASVILNVNNCTFVNNQTVRAAANSTPGTVQGGAITLEDSVQATIGLSRFIDNQAESGGAIQMYRSAATITQSYFEFNRAINGGGGAISMASLSSPTDFGKPKASLTINDSFILGDPNGQQVVAQEGGGIGVGGDRPSAEGTGGVPQNGTFASNQAVLAATNVVFANLVVQEAANVPGSGIGGAVSVDLGNVSFTSCLFMNDRALALNPSNLSASLASGGALSALPGSTIGILNTTFDRNTSDRYGGAIYANGTQLNITGGDFLENSVTFSPSEFQSFGAALYTTGDPTRGINATGAVQNAVFSLNNGMTIYEGDSAGAPPFNLMTYNNNQFFATSFGADVFLNNSQASADTVAQLNQLSIHGQAKSPAHNNVALNAAPVVVQLFAAPNRLYTYAAAGDSVQMTHNDIAFVMSGTSSGTLTGPGVNQPVTTPNGYQQVTATGTYSVRAGGQTASVVMTKPILLIAGADHPAGAYVPIFDALTGQQVKTLLVYDPFFSGGARVAMADVTGDGVPDFIVAAGPGGGPNVKIFDGVTGQVIPGPFGDFFAYAPNFAGGSFVAAGDINGDGRADVIIGADAGGGPNVKVFDIKNGTVILDFFALPAGFTGGVRVAAGNILSNGRNQLIAAAGPGGGPQVVIFDFDGVNLTTVKSFFVLPPAFTGGVYVAAGDVAGIGRDYIISGAAPGGGPDVTVLDPLPQTPTLINSFFTFNPAFTGGVRVAAGTDQSGKATVLAGAGPGGGPNADAFNGLTGQLIDSFFVFDPTFAGGIYVASR